MHVIKKTDQTHPEILSKGSIFIKFYVKWSFSFRVGGGGPSQGLVVPRICRAYVVERFSREGRGNDEPIRAAIDSWNKKTTKSTLSRWDARSFFKIAGHLWVYNFYFFSKISAGSVENVAKMPGWNTENTKRGEKRRPSLATETAATRSRNKHKR